MKKQAYKWKTFLSKLHVSDVIVQAQSSDDDFTSSDIDDVKCRQMLYQMRARIVQSMTYLRKNPQPKGGGRGKNKCALARPTCNSLKKLGWMLSIDLVA